MKMKMVVVLVLMALLLAACGAAVQASDSSLALFSDVDNAIETEKIPGAIRSRQVNANLEILGDAKAPAEKIVLNLFGDISPIVLFDRSETNVLGSYTWIGHLEDAPETKVTLVVTDGVLMGGFSAPDGSYQIMPIGDGIYDISEMDPAAYPAELEPIEVNDGGKE